MYVYFNSNKQLIILITKIVYSGVVIINKKKKTFIKYKQYFKQNPALLLPKLCNDCLSQFSKTTIPGSLNLNFERYLGNSCTLKWW